MNEFYIDLIITKNCNFRCSYCYERGKHSNENVSFETIDYFIKFIDDFRKTETFKNNYNGIKICLFGGEPTLELKKIKYILDKYKDDDRITFLIFTNGSNPGTLNLIQQYDKKINNINKIHVQISYDGEKIQELNRKYKSGKSSTETVKKLIDDFMLTDLSFSLKSTIRTENFGLLYETYLEFIELNKKYKKEILSYCPTIDYSLEYNNNIIGDLNFLNNKKILESNLLLIVKDCKENPENKNIFSLFSGYDVKSCSAGMHSICVNYDGNIYKCHGVIFSDDIDLHYINNIRNEDAVSIFESSRIEHIENAKQKDKDCNSCYAVLCMNCNSMKFSYSKKKEYYDRWYDRLCQPILCEYMKSISKYSIVVNDMLKKEK